MDPKTFGMQVEKARRQARLTQAALADLITAQSGLDISPQGVGYWCRGERIPSERMTLLALLYALYSQKGIDSLRSLNEILRAAGAGALHEDERQAQFPDIPITPFGGADVAVNSVVTDAPTPIYGFNVLVQVNPTTATLNALHTTLTSGPQQRWAGLFLLGVSTLSKRWTAERVLEACVGLLLVWITWQVTYPPLRWVPLPDHQLQQMILLYIGGAFTLPHVLAVLCRTRDDPFWQQKAAGQGRAVRLLTHLGAVLGFHVGYSLIFFLTLVFYHLQLFPLPMWLELLLSLSPLLWSRAAARQVPYNYVLADHEVRLTKRDFSRVLMALVLGPSLGGLYLFAFPLLLTPVTGVMLIISACIGIAIRTLWYRKHGKESLSVLMWLALFASGVVLYHLYQFTPWMAFILLSGLVMLLTYFITWLAGAVDSRTMV